MNKVSNYSAYERSQDINRVCWVNSIANLAIGVTKVGIAFLSGSLAIASDSVLNFGDFVNGILTIIGSKMSIHQPTKRHPFGFGRIEYMTTFLTSVFMCIIGFEFARIAIGRLKNPVDVKVSLLEYIALIALVFVKLLLFYYDKYEYRRTDNLNLDADAHDSLIDAFGTGLTVILIFIDKFTETNLDGWVSLGIGAFIILSSCKDIYKVISTMIGQEPSPKLIKEIEETSKSIKPVEGVKNIIIHSYGYNVKYGQMDVMLPDDMDVREASTVLSRLAHILENQYNIHFTFGLWPDNISYKNSLRDYRDVKEGVTVSRREAGAK